MSELHIYAQSQLHDEAYLVGTRESLRALRVAITEALYGDNDHQSKTEFFCSDGEGYHLYIKIVHSEWMNHIALPYTCESNPSIELFHPSSLFDTN